MRRIIASVNTTLDGYMEGPDGEGDLGWLMPFVPDGIADNARLLGEETDAILLGRGTYHGFAGFWPAQEGEFADLMNHPPKYVFSRGGALADPPWGSYDNAYLVEGDVEERVRAMKAEDGKDMVILGKRRARVEPPRPRPGRRAPDRRLPRRAGRGEALPARRRPDGRPGAPGVEAVSRRRRAPDLPRSVVGTTGKSPGPGRREGPGLVVRGLVGRYAAAGSGSARMTTASTTRMISSTGMPARAACLRIASGPVAS